MKLVVYSKDEYYFLTDEEFALATESWSKSIPILFRSRGLYLPIPRRPVGMPPEHANLQLAFSFSDEHYGLPGWIGIRKPVVDRETGEEVAPGAVFVRVIDHGGDKLRYRWHQLVPDFGSDRVREFIRSLRPIMADDILKDGDMRDAVSFEPLLTDFFLN